MRPVLDPLNAVLGRIAEELGAIADRLSSVTVETVDACAPGAVTSWQEIDQSQQRVRALATVVGRLRAQSGGSLVDLDALTVGIGLDAITDRIAGRACQTAPQTVPTGAVELF